MKQFATAGLVVLFAACGGWSSSQPAGAPESGLNLALAGSSFSAININGQDGALQLVGSGDSIRVTVSLGAKCPAGTALETDIAGQTLRLRVKPSTKRVCDERWTVTVPDRFAVQASFDRSDIGITNVSGGVQVDVGYGSLNLLIPSGPVNAHVINGSLNAEIAESQFGPVRLATHVGRTRLSINGAPIAHTRPPGAGDWIEMNGSGPDRVSLRATVGDVSLGLGEKGRE